MIYPIPQPVGSVTETAENTLAIRGQITREPAYIGHTGHYGAIREWLEQKSKSGAQKIVLDIDCCGGEVSGLSSLAHFLRGLSLEKIAHVTGIAASAAYCIASACDEIQAEPDSVIGAIGSYADAPKKSETVVVSERTPLKLEGGEQLQALANDSGDRFLLDVAEFRGFDASNLDAVADICGLGKLMTASEALRRKLIDKIIVRNQAMPNLEEVKETEKVEEKETPPAGDEMSELIDKLIEKLMPKVVELIESKMTEITGQGTKEEVKEEVVEEGAKCGETANIDRAARADVKRLEFALLRKDGKISDGHDEEIASKIYDLDRGLFRQIYDHETQDLLKRFSSAAGVAREKPKPQKSLTERLDEYWETHPNVGYNAAKAAVLKGEG